MRQEGKNPAPGPCAGAGFMEGEVFQNLDTYWDHELRGESTTKVTKITKARGFVFLRVLRALRGSTPLMERAALVRFNTVLCSS